MIASRARNIVAAAALNGCPIARAGISAVRARLETSTFFVRLFFLPVRLEETAHRGRKGEPSGRERRNARAMNK